MEHFISGQPGTKKLVVFSSSRGLRGIDASKKGNTEKLAEEIAKQTGADLFELISGDGHYPESFLKLQRTAQKDLKADERPAYEGDVPDFGKYKTVFVGGPAWYVNWPMINYTFLENHDLAGKELVPFITYVGTSGLSGIAARLKEDYPQTVILDGLELKGTAAQKMKDETEKKIGSWLSEMGACPDEHK